MTTDASPASGRLELLVVSSFNAGNLCSLLNKNEDPPLLHAVSGGFGQVMQSLLHHDPEVWTTQVRAVVVWTLPESVSPGYQRLAAGEAVVQQQLMDEVDAYCAALKSAPAGVKHILVPNWAVGPFEARLGLRDMDDRQGLSLALMRMNLRLAENLGGDPRAVVLDATRWVAVHGEKSFDRRLWYMSKTPFSLDFFKEAALEIKAAIGALQGQSRKLLILDLDETLWGGTVGDVGWQNVRLGGHDPVGEAFRDFQTALKSLKNRGILLGIVSKNDEAPAMEAIRSHPEMVLRPDDFAAWRINWRDKAQNIAELATELNLGLQSIVFIDDHPVERARVREALLEVLVPDWSGNPMDYKSALRRLRCFDQPYVGVEDARRSEMYLSDKKRRDALARVGSLEDWLQTLEIRVVVEPLNPGNLERVTQLFNKTNQMNLRTRRLAKAEIAEWSHQDGNTLLAFRVSDKYGDYGLVGIGSVSLVREPGGGAVLADFILSCRVMGRKVEEAMLHVLSETARGAGADRLQAVYVSHGKESALFAVLPGGSFDAAGGGLDF